MKEEIRRVAVIAGGIRDLAASIARRLAREGFDLAIIDQDRKSMVHAATRIGEITGRNILTITADIGVEGLMSAALHRVTRSLERIDLIVVYGGRDTSEAGFLHCQKYALPQMEEQGSGLILQIDPETGRLLRYRNVTESESKTITDMPLEPLSDIKTFNNIMNLIKEL
ncbi:SDR family NAD(P)-dependent oxidoreductase [Gemmatimonadota bacterium]